MPGKIITPREREDPGELYVVAMTATDNGTAITATYRGGQDAAYLVAVTLSINGANAGEMSIPREADRPPCPSEPMKRSR